MANLKELTKREERLSSGHRLCAGCGASVAVRQIMMGTESDAVVGCATGCLEVATTIYPYTAWKVPFIHNAFENSAATVSGVEAAYRALQRKGKIPMNKDVKFVAWGGDGGTYDIGLQSLSGAMERGHNMVYVCYDNEAYMNTGIQRSSATPFGASTNTAPAGSCSTGKPQFRKDLTMVLAAHHIPYAAQASIGYWNDVVKKSEKAFAVDGPAFILIFAPCPRGWRFANDKTIEIAKLAVETCFWPLYEIENGVFRLTRKISDKKKKDVIEWLKPQKRFAHLFNEGCKHIIEQIQQKVDEEWQKYLDMDGKKIF
ncbi:MAG: pyruvate synthase subunit PorB [Vulcanimicrobiota bacterium]